MAASTITIKLTDGKDIRRFSTDTVTYDGIHARAKELFGLDDDTKIAMLYRDDEGDLITMSSEEEMAEALALIAQQPTPTILRLTIKKMNKKNAKTAQAPSVEDKASQPDAGDAGEKDAVGLPPPLARLLEDLAKDAPDLVPGVKAALKQQPWLIPLVTQFAAEQPHMLKFGAEMLKNLCASTGCGPENLASMAAAFGPCGMVPPGCGFGGPFAPPVAEKAEGELEAVHPGVICDRSGMSPIVGNRWHLTGHDWDLCQAEYDKLDAREKALYVNVPPPCVRKGKCAKGKPADGEPIEKKSCAPPAGEEVHHGVTCDRSGMSPIVGPRYHLCGRNYDLCQAEYDKLDDEQKKAFERVPPRKPWGGPWGGRCGGGSGGFRGGCAKLAARFVSDVSIFDGTQMSPGTAFTKIWKIKNSGEVPWPPGTQMCFVGGDQMSANLTVPITHDGPVMPGEEVDVSVDMIAPREHGRYVGYFRLTGPHARRRWGQRVWAHVQVVDPAADPVPPTEIEIAAALEKAEEIKATAASEDEADDDTADDAVAAKLPAPPSEPTSDNKPAEPVNKPAEEAEPAPSSLRVANVEQAPAALAPAASPAPSVVSVCSSAVNVDADAEGKVMAPPMAEPLPPAAAEAVELAQAAAERAAAPVDKAAQETGDLLAAMGFTDEAIVAYVIDKNGADLDACARDLVSLGEWEETLNDLDEMGFGDVLLNQKLLIKNGGSLKKTVKELVKDA